MAYVGLGLLLACLALAAALLWPRRWSTDAGRTPDRPASTGAVKAATPTSEAGAEPTGVDIFAVRTWEPEPPPPTEVALPAEPVAPTVAEPPLPFQYLGRIAENGRRPVFLLSEGGTVLTVRVGQRIDSRYRVEKFQHGELVFRYLPLNLRQTLTVGALP